MSDNCIWEGKVHPYFANNVAQLTTILSSQKGVQAIWLFGSVANGKCTRWSDIDMAVITTEPVSLREYYTKNPQATTVDLLIYTPEEFAEESVTLKNNIERGILLWKEKLLYEI